MQCESGCNPFVSTCGARFCTEEEMHAHVCTTNGEHHDLDAWRARDQALAQRGLDPDLRPWYQPQSRTEWEEM